MTPLLETLLALEDRLLAGEFQAQLVWKSQRADRPSCWRSSLWQFDTTHGWRLRFHQATPIPAP